MVCGHGPHAGAVAWEEGPPGAVERSRRDVRPCRHRFLVLHLIVGASLLVGGRAAIDPFLHPALDANDPRAGGDVVVTMPDGKFCRHMSFDNATASMIEGTIEPCRTDISRDFGVPGVAPHGGFAWGPR